MTRRDACTFGSYKTVRALAFTFGLRERLLEIAPLPLTLTTFAWEFEMVSVQTKKAILDGKSPMEGHNVKRY